MLIQFKYEAVAEDGSLQTGVITAETAEKTAELLAEDHLLPIRVERLRPGRINTILGFFKRTYYEDLITFTNNLTTLSRAGIPILKSLSLIKIGSATSRFNAALTQIRFQMQSGQSLSRAMSECPDVFPRVYVSAVAAGEESGHLDDVLEQLSATLEKELTLSRQIKSGITYPVMVISTLLAAFVVMMIYVVPKFTAFYSAFEAELPLPTRILTGLSDFAIQYWPILVAIIIIGIFGFKKLTSFPWGQRWVDRILLRIPVVGDLIIKGNVARFSMLMSILFQAGIPIVRTMELLREAVKNSIISLEIARMETIFAEGREEALTKEEFEFFPETALQMIKIGLESGTLDQILEELGRHFSKEVSYTTRQLTSILEPVLTFVLGIFVLVLALAIFLPMWNLINVFRG